MGWTEGWHICPADALLGHKDGRPIVVGETLTVSGDPQVCFWGLHASERVHQALACNGVDNARLCRVRVGGKIDVGGSQIAATQRTCLAMLTQQETDLIFRRWGIRCIRQDIWHLLTDERLQHVVEVTEAWCDGATTFEEMNNGNYYASQICSDLWTADTGDDMVRTAQRYAAEAARWTSCPTSSSFIILAVEYVARACAIGAAWEASNNFVQLANREADRAATDGVRQGAAWDVIWQTAWEATTKVITREAERAVYATVRDKQNAHLEEVCLAAVQPGREEA